MPIKIGEDTEYIWYCHRIHFINCQCLESEEGELDDEDCCPSIEDCFYSTCSSLELAPKKCPKCGAENDKISMLGSPEPFGEEQLYRCSKCKTIISVELTPDGMRCSGLHLKHLPAQ